MRFRCRYFSCDWKTKPHTGMAFLAVNLRSIHSAPSESDPQRCRKAGVSLSATGIWQPLWVMDRKWLMREPHAIRPGFQRVFSLCFPWGCQNGTILHLHPSELSLLFPSATGGWFREMNVRKRGGRKRLSWKGKLITELKSNPAVTNPVCWVLRSLLSQLHHPSSLMTANC